MSETPAESLGAVGEELRMGPVVLRVANPERMRWFYREIVGLRVLDDGAPGRLGVDDRTLVELLPEPGEESAGPQADGGESAKEAPEPPPAGLYHLALRVPTRSDLGGVLEHLRAAGWPLRGGSDHGVSEAIYLADPERNGLEIYADRPRERWPHRGGELAMGTDPLDVEALLADAPETTPEKLSEETVVGHVHLEVSDLEASETFYGRELGIPVTQRSYPGALFLGAGGYHHHVGLNEWVDVRARRAGETPRGLAEFEIQVAPGSLPDGEEVRLVDPDGIPLRIRPRR